MIGTDVRTLITEGGKEIKTKENSDIFEKHAGKALNVDGGIEEGEATEDDNNSEKENEKKNDTDTDVLDETTKAKDQSAIETLKQGNEDNNENIGEGKSENEDHEEEK
ncbi:MAG TPA: hypothetical protein VJ044_07135 [Candidatus Hodarchaeales archaeon]|nr:hypothetical protein [Candidatus Hodarchaeales archaeon]